MLPDQPPKVLILAAEAGTGRRLREALAESSAGVWLSDADLPLGEGEGEVVGFDLNKMNRKKLSFLRRKLGIVFQDFHLLTDRNVAENLLFTLRATGWKDKKAMQSRIDEVMDMVGLNSKGKENPFELSGGEQQRVVIARALLNHPELILADEPTGNLDPDMSDDILRLLIDVSNQSGSSVILATHNYTLIDKFPARIIKCQDGKLQDFKHTKVT